MLTTNHAWSNPHEWIFLSASSSAWWMKSFKAFYFITCMEWRVMLQARILCQTLPLNKSWIKTIKCNETAMYANQRPQIYFFTDARGESRPNHFKFNILIIILFFLVPFLSRSFHYSPLLSRFRFQVSAHIYLTFMISLNIFLRAFSSWGWRWTRVEVNLK